MSQYGPPPGDNPYGGSNPEQSGQSGQYGQPGQAGQYGEQSSYGQQQGGQYGGSNPYGQQGHHGQQQPGKGLAITALVLGILGLLSSFIFGGLVLGIPAIICGLIASSKAKKGTGTGRGMAIAGWITGLLGLLVSLVVVGLAVWAFTQTGDFRQCLEQAGDDQAAMDQCERDFERDIEENFGG